MTLKNLLGISLDAITLDPATIAKLQAADDRNIADANLAGLSERRDARWRVDHGRLVLSPLQVAVVVGA